MAAVIGLAMATIETLWQGTTPPDRTNRPYRRSTARGASPGTVTSDRQFQFTLPQRDAVVGQSSTSSTVQWTLGAVLYLGQAGRSQDELWAASADESNLLASVVERNSVWPTGVIEVVTEEVQPAQANNKGDLEITFRFTVTTFETDGD